MPLTKTTEPQATWYPTSVANLEGMLVKVIQRGRGFTHVYALRKNIAYNLQYLEFLDRVLVDIKLSSVLSTQTYKMFVLVGCSIMESLLTYLLIKSGHHKATQWEEECVMPGQEKKVGDERKRIDCHVLRKLTTPKRVEMSFDSMIKKAESKHLLGGDHSIYAKLQYLRNLRNKVHLQGIDDPTDTDWNAFHRHHLSAMAQVIHAVFTGPIFRSSQAEKGFFEYLEKYNAQQVDALD